MAYTAEQYVADQLRAQAPDGKWDDQIDRAAELARIMVRAGIVDLSSLQLVPVKVTRVMAPWQPPSTQDAYAFGYMGRTVGFLGTPDDPTTEPIFQTWPVGMGCAWSAVGHGQTGYVVRTATSGHGIQIVPVWSSSSDWSAVRGFVLQAASFLSFVALPLAGLSAANLLASQVLGPTFAAAYPALTTAVGNVALATVFSGGNVELAVKSAITTWASGGVGSTLGEGAATLSGIPAVGAVTAAATSAFVAGGDVKAAVGRAILSTGAPMIGNLFDTFGDPPISYGDDGLSFLPGDLGTTGGGPIVGDGAPNDYSFLPPGVADWGTGLGADPFGPGFDADLIGATDPNAPDGAAVEWDLGGGNPDVKAVAVATTPKASDFAATPLIQTITNAALAAISVLAAWQRLKNPQVQPRARVVNADGSVSVVGNNGLIQTRTPDGRIVAQRPPVGVPQATISGNYIVNNGDGTYSIISPTGQKQTYPYTTATAVGGAGLPGGALPWIVGGVALLVLMRK
jgi:hypothetical protein